MPDEATAREDPEYVRAEIQCYAWDIFKHCAPHLTPEQAWAKGEAWYRFKIAKESPE